MLTPRRARVAARRQDLAFFFLFSLFLPPPSSFRNMRTREWQILHDSLSDAGACHRRGRRDAKVQSAPPSPFSSSFLSPFFSFRRNVERKVMATLSAFSFPSLRGAMTNRRVSARFVLPPPPFPSFSTGTEGDVTVRRAASFRFPLPPYWGSKPTMAVEKGPSRNDPFFPLPLSPPSLAIGKGQTGNSWFRILMSPRYSCSPPPLPPFFPFFSPRRS